jgi:RNA-directed DNA polymerase
MPLTARRNVALGLADAMLAGEPEQASACERCVDALGGCARWVAPLVREMVDRFAHGWRDAARRELADAIAASPTFERAWNGSRRPRLRSVPVTPPRMAPLPDALAGCVVPDLPTPADIARWLGLSIDELAWLTGPLGQPPREGAQALHYSYRWLPKRMGGVRLLETPKARLRAIQRRVLHRLLEYVPPHEAVHGFRPRHSCVTNARPHVGQAVVMRMDLADFFASVGGGRVYAFFISLGYPVAAARVFTRLTTTATTRQAWSAENLQGIAGERDLPDWQTRKRLASPHLPQGAPTSPMLANLCAFSFDMRVQALAETFGVQYTRYADDLTFSGGEVLARRSAVFEANVSAIALEEGFRVNHRKTRVMRAAVRQSVTGVVVNRTPNVPREQYDRLKATLHNCLQRGVATQCAADPGELRNRLAGHIAHLAAIHPVRAARLRGMFERIRWEEGVAAT